MKRLVLLTGLFAAALCKGNGQGTVYSANSAATLITNTLTLAPVIAGTSFKVALYYLPDQAPTPSSSDFDARGFMLGPAVYIGPVAGQYSIGMRSTPSTTLPGEAAWFQVRLWETAFGDTYEQAVNNPQPMGGRLALVGTSAIVKVITGDPTTTPAGSPSLVAVPAFLLPVIPEPSTLGLALLGACAWLLTRRDDRWNSNVSLRNHDQAHQPDNQDLEPIVPL